jgi:hypothetical protein
LVKKWKIKVNPVKSIQITLITRRALCPQVHINNVRIPIKTEEKYLGLHLDQKLTWKTNIKAKIQQLELKLKNMYWLMNKKSKVSVENKLTIYKAIFKQVGHTASRYEDAASRPHKNTPNVSIKNSQDDNRLPLVRLKSNTEQRPQNSVCMRRNHSPCQQIETTHHWPQHPANK